MFHTIKRILDIAGDQKKYIYAGIVCNILKTFSMAMMLMAVYVVISHLDSLTAEGEMGPVIPSEASQGRSR